MSRDFRTKKRIPFSEIFGGRLEHYNVRLAEEADNNEKSRCCLTDGSNYVWAYRSASGKLSSLTKLGQNDPQKILEAIATEFQTEIFDEEEPQFWGFDTEDEWNAWQKGLEEQHRLRDAEFVPSQGTKMPISS